MKNNPLLTNFTTPHQTVPFHLIDLKHYLPAFKESIATARTKIDTIVLNKAAPTFSNTLEALEYTTYQLDRISSAFFNLNHAATNKKMQELAREISPMLTEFANDVAMNKELFARVKTVYVQRNQLSLTSEQQMLVKNCYKSFVRQGANLELEKANQFREISRELSQLSLKFNEHVLAATNAFELHLTNPEDLSGLPEGIVDAAKTTANNRNKKGWVFTLQYPSYVPFMQYSDKRELREKMFKTYSSRCFGDKFDNQEIIKKLIALRLQKARLLGYQNYAEFVLEERMAENPENVNTFLNDLLKASLPKAQEEFAELQEFARSLGADFDLQRWDWAYYAEKLKTQKFKINDEITRPYFELERVKKGIFDLANRLYGLTFKENTEIQKYHPEVVTYEVYDEKNNFLAVFYLDFHPRDSKQSGAWMTSFLDQYSEDGREVRPHISIVTNFTRPTKLKPSLLTFNEVTTFLHEFGHALHGMLSRCNYASLSGTSVYRDFVELPSQFMENFAYQKEWLKEVAQHYKTGEKIPGEYVQRIKNSSNFHSGYSFLRQLSFGFTDMAWHTVEKVVKIPVNDFEKIAMGITELFPVVEGSCMSPAFSHIFAGGYAAGYYGYKWAEVLDADAFAAFEEKGIYNRKIAMEFQKHILERGGTEHPVKLYERFRGQKPSIVHLLQRSGLK